MNKKLLWIMAGVYIITCWLFITYNIIQNNSIKTLNADIKIINDRQLALAKHDSKVLTLLEWHSEMISALIDKYEKIVDEDIENMFKWR